MTSERLAELRVQWTACAHTDEAVDAIIYELFEGIEALQRDLKQAKRETDEPCHCGSGCHPRHCKRHPWAYDLHVAQINHEQLREERDELEKERDEAWAEVSREVERFHSAVMQNVGIGKDRDAIRKERDEARKMLDAYDERATRARLALDAARVPEHEWYPPSDDPWEASLQAGGRMIHADERIARLAAERDELARRIRDALASLANKPPQ